MTFLLDVNVLIALLDRAHVHHDQAHLWFAQDPRRSWATCPITENGVARILGHVKYPNTPGSPGIVVETMRQLKQLPGHVFWPDTISLLDPTFVHAGRLHAAAQVTDAYLLALAVAHEGKLATFDRRLSTAMVEGGEAALHLIGPARSD